MDTTNPDTTLLAPSSITDDPDIAAVLRALDGQWTAIGAAIPLLGILATIDQQPEPVVDKLAYDFHVDYWEDDWDLVTKRAAVINSIRLHRIAGTRGALEDLIDMIWHGAALLLEWWEYGGEPGTCQIVLTDQHTQDRMTEFLASMDTVKRASIHLSIETLNDCAPGESHWSAVWHTNQHYRLEAA